MIIPYIDTYYLGALFEIYILYLLISIIYWLYKTFLRSAKDHLNIYGKDSYVLITGCTDGIGKGYAKKFAELGFNLILVSRTEKKLNDVRNELLQINNKLNIVVKAFDFSKNFTANTYRENFSIFVDKFDVSVLVNNVGISHEDYFYKLVDNKTYNIEDYINVNIYPQTFLTQMFMDKLSKRKNRSAIISLSSIAAEEPYTGNAIYTATKGYNDYLSRALFGEYNYEKGNIDFLSVKPAYVESNMSQMKPDGFDCCSVEQHVNAVIKDLGYTCVTNGFWSHKLQGWIVRNSPEFLLRYFFKDSKEKEERLQERHKKKD